MDLKTEFVVAPTMYIMLVFLMLATVYPAQSRVLSAHQFATVQLATGGEQKSERKSLQVAKLGKTQVDATARSSRNETCPYTWFVKNGSDCVCGSEVGEKVTCEWNDRKEKPHMQIRQCYCMTYNNDNQSLLLGGCFYTCTHRKSYLHLSSNTSKLNQDFCGAFNRQGKLCGRCIEGFAPPVYSYDMKCVNCTDYHKNWLKFMLYSFVPLTGFFFVVIMFRINATSGLMNAFILITQILTAPVLMRGLQEVHHHDRSRLPLLLLSSVYGIWNLDFFRLFYSPFCLHPKMSMLQALALDYVIAIYPLILIAVTYLLVELHDKFRWFMRLWKPFQWCFVHFRRRWNIRASLIDALATFLLLSYVKFLNVSYDILSPLTVYNVSGHTLRPCLLYDGTVEYFGKEHLPYAILALGVLLIFNIFPILLFCLYPFCCFQRCLAHLKLRTDALHVFMDAFQGCYKDGTNGTKDRRWFSAVYLMVRFVFLLAGIISFSEFTLTLGVVINLPVLAMLAVFQPYKSHAYNAIDALLILGFIFMFVSGAANSIAHSIDIQFKELSRGMIGLSLIIPLAYLIGVMTYKLLSHKRWMEIFEKLQSWMSCRCSSSEIGYARSEESLPDRLTHPEVYETLSSESEDERIGYHEPTEHTYLLGL